MRNGLSNIEQNAYQDHRVNIASEMVVEAILILQLGKYKSRAANVPRPSGSCFQGNGYQGNGRLTSSSHYVW